MRYYNLKLAIASDHGDFEIKNKIYNYLIEKGYSPEYGARPLRRLIEQEVEDRIAEQILENKLEPGSVIVLSVKNNNLVIGYEAKQN